MKEKWYIEKERCPFAKICRSNCSQNLCTVIEGIDDDFSKGKRKKLGAVR